MKKLMVSTLREDVVFCTNYFENLDKLDIQNNARKIYDDIKRFKKIRKEIKLSGDETNLEIIEWFIARLRAKRQDIIAGYKASASVSVSIHINITAKIVVIDSSYDIRDIKPYCYYVSKMEKDLRDNQKAILKSQLEIERLEHAREAHAIWDEADKDNQYEENNAANPEGVIAAIGDSDSDEKDKEEVTENNKTERRNTKGSKIAVVVAKEESKGEGEGEEEEKANENQTEPPEAEQENQDEDDKSVASNIGYEDDDNEDEGEEDEDN